jgi:hypothetical protein
MVIRIRVTVLAVLVAASAVAGCTTVSTAPPSGTTTGSTTATSAGTSTPSTTTGPSTSPPAGCRSGAVAVEIHAAPPQRMCVLVGATIVVTAESSPRQPWQPLQTTDAGVLRCDSHPAVEGSIAGGCVALAAGSATLHTDTTPFAGDPHGPPQLEWELAITVIA